MSSLLLSGACLSTWPSDAQSDSRKTGQIPLQYSKLPITERPAEVEDRAVPGHWEGDLLSGGKNSYIATLVERHSRFLMLIKVPGKETAVVVSALSKHVRKLPATLRRSLTWDRGLEMAKHKDFTVAPMCRSTSAIHKVLGSAGRTKTRICC